MLNPLEGHDSAVFTRSNGLATHDGPGRTLGCSFLVSLPQRQQHLVLWLPPATALHLVRLAQGTGTPLLLRPLPCHFSTSRPCRAMRKVMGSGSSCRPRVFKDLDLNTCLSGALD